MTTIIEIEKAIETLPSSDYKELRNWFLHFDQDKWDAEFEEDVKNGKLAEFANEALKDYKEGKCRKL